MFRGKFEDIAIPVINEADERFRELSIVKERLEGFKKLCSVFDKVINEIECENISIEVDDNTADILIAFETDYFEVSDKTSPFYVLMMYCNSFSINTVVSKSGYNVEFVFRFVGVWES